MHKQISAFTPDALSALKVHDWPGNVRELSNVIERLVILSGQGKVGQADVLESLTVPASPEPVPRTARELSDLKKELRSRAADSVEKAFLLDALRRNDHNISRAAEDTGMQRSNFQALLKKHGLRIKDIVAGKE